MAAYKTPEQPPWKALLKGGLIGLLLLVFFLLGFALRGVVDPGQGLVAAQAASGPYALLNEIQAHLEEHYFRDLPEQAEMTYAAARGLMGSLNDRYTLFNPPVVTRNESDALAGEHGGIGVDVQYAADGRYLLYPFPESPAAQAGIRDGDVLLAINGEALGTEMSLDVIRQMLKGEVRAGNGVTIRVQAFDSTDEREFTIEFAVVQTPSVIWRTLLEDNRIGYIHLTMFTGRSPEEVQAAIDALQATGIQALILDLRNNPGGLLQETLTITDNLLEQGVLFYEVSRGQERLHEASPGAQDLDLPLIVLVNRGTASAAELLAGALQQNDRALVIGQQTAGKGFVQVILPLSDGSSIHVTSSEWLAPGRLALKDVGLEPDIPMIPAADGRDVELDEAIRQLRQVLEQE